jgi:hypothetical protein
MAKLNEYLGAYKEFYGDRMFDFLNANGFFYINEGLFGSMIDLYSDKKGD